MNLADYIEDKYKENPTFQDKETYYISDCGWDLLDWGCYGDECTLNKKTL